MSNNKYKFENAGSCASEVKNINPNIVNDKYLEKNKEIEVDVIVDDVEVLSSNLAEIDIKFSKTKKEYYEVISEDGIFRLKSISNQNHLGMKRGKVTIYVPDGAMYNRVLLKNLSGDMKIKDLSAVEIVASSVSGDIKFYNIDSKEKMSINSVSGDIVLGECRVGMLKASSVSGDIIVENTSYIDSDIKSVSGDVDIITNNDELN